MRIFRCYSIVFSAMNGLSVGEQENHSRRKSHIASTKIRIEMNTMT